MERERVVEEYLVRTVVAVGGVAWKLAGRSGLPDRMVVLPGGTVTLVEVKTKGGRLSKLQQVAHRQLRRLGVEVEVVWSRTEVDELVERLVGNTGATSGEG